MRFVKVKTSQGSLYKNKGTELAPDAILNNLKINADECRIVKGNINETNKAIEQQQGDFFIGGDHSITYPLFKSFAQKYKDKNIGLVAFDAHPDCVNNFKPPTHEDFVRVLVEDNVLKPENLLLIGLRNIDPIEQEFLDKNKINCVLMQEIINKERGTIWSKAREFVKKIDALYLSIDIDVLDPKYAPGTGYPESDGFELENFIFLLKGIKKLKMPMRVDLVEVNPLKDRDNTTIKSAQQIVKVFSN